MSIDTVNDLPRRVQYTAIAAQDEFDYPFPIFTDEDLVVYVDDEQQALNTDYTVSGEGDDLGGTITFASPLAGDEIVTIYSELAIERDTDFQQNGPWNSQNTNDQLDKLTLICRELKDRIGRAIRWPITAFQSSDGLELSPIASWYGKFLRVSETGILEAAELVSSVVAVTRSIIGQLINPLTEREVLAGATPTDYGCVEGSYGRYGCVGDGVADDTAAVATMWRVGGQGVWLDWGSDTTFLTESFVLSAANVNIPPSMVGDNVRFKLKSGSGYLCYLERPEDMWPVFTTQGSFTFDGNGLGKPFALHGSQDAHYLAVFRFVNAFGGPGCTMIAENGYGIQNNTGVGWISGDTQDEGGTHAGFSIKTIDGSNRIASNLWLKFKSKWNEGPAYDIDHCSDDFVGCEAEKNDGAAFLVDNCPSLGIHGGYFEHNHQNMSGGGASDATPDVTIESTANSSRIQAFGGRDSLGTWVGYALGTSHIDMRGQGGGISLSQLGMGFGGANAVDNGLGFLDSADILVRASGTTKWSWNYLLDRLRAHVNFEFLKASIHNIVTDTYSASITPDAGAGDEHVITVTNGTAFAINAPTNPVSGMVQTYTIRNSSGGAVGVITWNAVFKMAALTNPANGFSRSVTFRYNGTNWVQKTQTGVDVPN